MTATLRVLLVDDTPDVRLLLRMLLDAMDGLQIVGEGGNGRDAIQLAERLRPDLIVIDHRMPVLDGISALPGLREVAPDSRVVVLSADPASGTEPSAGAVAYVQKSVTGLGEELLTAASVLDGAVRALSAHPAPPAPIPAAAVRAWDLAGAVARMNDRLAALLAQGAITRTASPRVTVRLDEQGVNVRVGDAVAVELPLAGRAG